MAPDPVEILKERAKREGKAALARRLGISRTGLYYVLEGQRQPGRKVLRALGIEQKVSYRKVSPEGARDR
jgi:DNA-binding phage protein